MSPPRFFAFNPRRIRAGLLACAAIGAALTGIAFATLHRSVAPFSLTRSLLLGLLTVLCAVASHRLRPRAAWGIALDDLGLTMAPPLVGPSLRLAWREISRVARGGKRGETLIVYAEPEGRVVVGRQLFASGREFDELSDALMEKKPPKMLDA